MTEIQAVKELGEQIGYGNLMSIASGLWRELLKPDGVESGAFIPVTHSMVDKTHMKLINTEILNTDLRIKKFNENE